MVYESDNYYVIKNDILQPEVTYCGGTGKFPRDYQSYGNVVTIRFLTDGISSADAGVKLVYTSYKPPQGMAFGKYMATTTIRCRHHEVACLYSKSFVILNRECYFVASVTNYCFGKARRGKE